MPSKESIEQTPTVITDFVFSKLIENITPDDSSLECPALKGVFASFEIDFFAWDNDNYNLQIGDFGYHDNGVWIQLTPTRKQLQDMQLQIAKEVSRLEKIST